MTLPRQPARQGDVLLVPTTDTPTKPAPLDADGSATLAHGEVTGHRHRFEDGAAVTLSQGNFGREGGLILEVTSGDPVLRHEEHAPIPVPPGRYEVRIKCEYDPTVHGGARQVED
jgi:hypothetical protein